MKITKLLFLFTISLPFFLSGQIEISGKVFSKNDGDPLPGANVTIKGTKIGVQTNFDGEFSIKATKESDVLEISYLGFITKEVKLQERTYIEIQLKEDCNIDWFDAQHIGLYLNSGVFHNPLGGKITFSSPHLFGYPLLKAGISYQTNTKDNKFLNTYINLHHLFVSCEFEASLNTSYRELLFEKNIRLNSRAIETRLNWGLLEIILGYSHITFSNSTDSKLVNGSGITLGMATWIGQPFMMSVSGKATAYNNLAEYHFSLEKRYKGLNSFLRFYKVNSFIELSLGVGFEITYLFKSQRISRPK